ncbi:lysozyme [Enhydrobacter aerosaccus]|uniref:Lysozyme n=1 Tax=Enhydrobacter aerosaccus TaxID=225324 RepID=A0A1T4RPF3_9HYPH|nr:lysozyme [Enhydrobacter aerosaccus]SKA17895.1 lysozyme [Enhydrobacter aerosaccus]
MIVSEEGLEFLVEEEGKEYKAYPDPGPSGYPWTIGVGHTGADVYPGLVWTDEQIREALINDAAVAGSIVNGHVTVPLTQSQFDALVSFVFNIGQGIPGQRDGFVWLRSGYHSTMLRKLNAGDYKGAADEFPKWANPPLPGLIRRRAKEREMFLRGIV